MCARKTCRPYGTWSDLSLTQGLRPGLTHSAPSGATGLSGRLGLSFATTEAVLAKSFTTSVAAYEIYWGEFIGSRVLGAMKKKARKSDTEKKKAKKTTKRSPQGKNLDPAKVREEIAEIVKAEAKDITRAVMVQANQGQLAQARYLLEMAGVYPLATDMSPTSDREESLAETLLDRLKIPKTPVVHDELQKEKEEDEGPNQAKKEAAAEPEKVDDEEEEKTETVTVH